MNYDFESFKKLYGLDDNKDVNSKDTLSSEVSVLDELENEASLYDELVTPNDLNLEHEMVYEVKSTPLADIFKDDELEKTLKIDSFKLDSEMAEVLEPTPISEVKTKKKKKRLLPFTVAEDHHLEYAFAHCAVLGFITAAMGSGMLIYILNHMNSL